MKKRLRVITMFAAAVLLLMLSGCFTKSADRLYVLPQLSEEYLQLQSELDKVRSTGAEYSAPTAGSYRQAVQLEDIDGDGLKEAIAFFKVEDDPKPLKVYIFNNNGGRYSKKAVIEGEGMNIESVAYVDLSGDGVKELLAGWQMSPGVKRLSVYSIQDFEAALEVSTDYTRYSILDSTGDGCSDLMVLRLSGSELSGEAELYTVDKNGELVSSTARLSTGVESVSQIRTGVLSSGQKALFAESVINGSSIVTDILVWYRGALKNITAHEETGISEGTLRTYTSVSCRDIDGDGTMEVPCPIMLPTRSSTAVYWAIEWYSYNVRGENELKLTTFYNVTDGWYFVLPEEWSGRITVRREDTVPGERAIVFSELGAGVAANDILEIYSLTGEGREARAEKGNRFFLTSSDNTIYAANLFRAGVTLRVSEKYVKENFSIIYSEWITE